jgi:arylsulfatase A-like enzyme
VVASPVQTVDLAATVLDVARVEVPPSPAPSDDVPSSDGRPAPLVFNDGRSFAASMTDPGWTLADMLLVENEFGENDHDIRSFVLNSVREGPWKLVLTERNKYRPPSDPRYSAIELYNLAADPFEHDNLFEQEPEIGKRLLDRLRGHTTYLNETGFRHIKPKALSPELEAELRALGYL